MVHSQVSGLRHVGTVSQNLLLGRTMTWTFPLGNGFKINLSDHPHRLESQSSLPQIFHILLSVLTMAFTYHNR